MGLFTSKRIQVDFTLIANKTEVGDSKNLIVEVENHSKTSISCKAPGFTISKGLLFTNNATNRIMPLWEEMHGKFQIVIPAGSTHQFGFSIVELATLIKERTSLRGQVKIRAFIVDNQGKRWRSSNSELIQIRG